MKKNRIYVVCVGLLGVVIAACGLNGAGDAVERPQVGLYSSSYTALANTIVYLSNRGLLEGIAEIGPGGGVNPIDGSKMLKLNFQQLSKLSSLYFTNTQDAVPIDITSYRNGSIVFSIYYKNLNPEPTQFSIIMQSGTGMNQENTATLNMFDYTSDQEDDWHTYRIPLADFKTQNSDLDFADITRYFEIGRPGYGTGVLLNGEAYLDNVYFDMTQ